MNYFNQEVNKIIATCYSNHQQIEKAVEIKKYLDLNYANDVSLDTLIENIAISRFHLIRIFKKYFGLTPRQYLIDIRLRKAQKLLLEGKAVSDTCYAVGFESIGSFSILFSRKLGIPPSKYKQAIFDKSVSTKNPTLPSYLFKQ